MSMPQKEGSCVDTNPTLCVLVKRIKSPLLPRKLSILFVHQSQKILLAMIYEFRRTLDLSDVNHTSSNPFSSLDSGA
jgi:hypothetical protein